MTVLGKAILSCVIIIICLRQAKFRTVLTTLLNLKKSCKKETFAFEIEFLDFMQ